MVIYEGKKHILTNYQQVKNGGKATDSDHMTEYMDVKLEVTSEKPKRQEVFNFKDSEAQEKFRKLTTETKEFSSCFMNNDKNVLNQVEKWRKVLKTFCHKAFKKVRITKKSFVKPIKPSLSALINQRNNLTQIKDSIENEMEIEKINLSISEMEAEERRNEIVKRFKSYSDNPEAINMQQMWKVLKTLWPKCGVTLPTSKRNHQGKIVSGPSAIKKLLAREYKDRLRSRPLRPDLHFLKKRRKIIFKLKMKLAENQRSSDWTLSDLERAIRNLKKNKSRDFEGYLNELFKSGVAGEDLKKSLLLMCNRLKRTKMIPKFMNYSNITTVPKKGSTILLKNERSIFRVSVIRSILMRLIYNMKYSDIDENMSDCQMGARKGKGCKNNLFIINGIIHEVMKSKKMTPILLQIYDYSQMFDSIELEQAISDIYDAGVRDDVLSLLYQANAEIHMAVKTPSGLTERQVLKDVVLQGDTWGSILASVQVDSIGKECQSAGYGYIYKDSLQVSLLGLVDDTIGITEVGFKAQQLNVFMNVKTAEKRLQFGATKCKTMLIGKNTKNTLNCELFVDSWNVQYKENVNTGELDLIETYIGQVPMEQTDKHKYLGFVLSCSGDNMANVNEMRKKSIGVIRNILNRLESLNLKRYYL